MDKRWSKEEESLECANHTPKRSKKNKEKRYRSQ